jgi:hypothetical protein
MKLVIGTDLGEVEVDEIRRLVRTHFAEPDQVIVLVRRRIPCAHPDAAAYVVVDDDGALDSPVVVDSDDLCICGKTDTVIAWAIARISDVGKECTARRYVGGTLAPLLSSLH